MKASETSQAVWLEQGEYACLKNIEVYVFNPACVLVRYLRWSRITATLKRQVMRF